MWSSSYHRVFEDVRDREIWLMVLLNYGKWNYIYIEQSITSKYTYFKNSGCGKILIHRPRGNTTWSYLICILDTYRPFFWNTWKILSHMFIYTMRFLAMLLLFALYMLSLGVLTRFLWSELITFEKFHKSCF